MKGKSPDMVDLVLKGDRRAASSLMKMVDDRAEGYLNLMDRLYPHTGGAFKVGIAGSPGCGKSTIVDAMIPLLRKEGKRVGVVAIDPSSPLSGGALLGDRIRMQRHSLDDGVFIRSVATRGTAGGIASSTLDICRIMEALGMDFIVIETIGLGQDEVDVRMAANANVLVLSPDTGDAIQIMKAGVMEIADVFVVNKIDREGAESVCQELTAFLSGTGDTRRFPVVRMEATAGKGAADLLGVLLGFKEPAGRREEKRLLEVKKRLGELFSDLMENRFRKEMEDIVKEICEGKKTPYRAFLKLKASMDHWRLEMTMEKEAAGNRAQAIIEVTEKYGAHNYRPLEIVLCRGEGVWVWDVEGQRYMDMLSAYSALNQGHRHPRIMKALKDQAARLTLTSRAFHNNLLGDFCRFLADLTGMEMVLPMNTGAEAVETAIKAARKWAYEVKKVRMYDAEIIVCNNNFHGRTTTIVSFSSEEYYRKYFGPFAPGFKLVPYGDLGKIEEAITPSTCAVMVEPIQGEAGIIVPPEGYMKGLRDLCRNKNILFILDEIQTGLGRTGKLFCYEHEGARPDVLVLGKAMGGGVIPISAVTSGRDILGLFTPGEHGSTFGGNPLACAVAIEAMKVIVEEDLPARSARMGEYFLEELGKIGSDYVKEVRGKGLMIGVELFPEAGGARRFCEELARLGILCKETHEDVVRFAPPLIIEREEIDWALERIRKVLQ